MCVLIPDVRVKTIEACTNLLSPDSTEILGVALAYTRKHPELRGHVTINEDQYNSARTAIANKTASTLSVDCIFTVTAGKRVNLSTEFQILSLTVTCDR